MDSNIDRAVQHATAWMDSVEGVTGVGQGQTTDGRDAVIVYATRSEVADELPSSIEGVPVVVQQTGAFEAQ